MDESGFKLAELYDKVYSERGVKEVVEYVRGSESDRGNGALLAVKNASENMLRLLILYKGRMHIKPHCEAPHDTCYLSTNSSRFMDNNVLTEYLG